MKPKLLLVILPAVCLCCRADSICAQQRSRMGVDRPIKATSMQIENDSSAPSVRGRISGILKDPSGAIVSGAKVTIRNGVSGFKESLLTNRQGYFNFIAVPVGHYQIIVKAKGFGLASVHEVAVAVDEHMTVEIALKLASISTSVMVKSPTANPVTATLHQVNQNDRDESRNSAELLASMPGISLRSNGQLASSPMLNGLGDERTKLLVNGMTVSNACPNHMNPPLSYISPSNAAQITVMAGITPVSVGGDSLGGTISIESRSPDFAGPAERLHEEGTSSGFYWSNGQNYGGSLSGWIAGHNLGIGYTGSWVTSDDYTDGSGRKVTSTYAQSTDQALTLAARSARNLVVLQAGLHHIPYQGFVNARMDMVRNYAASLNLHYLRRFDHGGLDTHAFWQSTSHSMNIGRDKITFPMSMWMPMNDHGTDIGYSANYEVPFSTQNTLRIGNEFHHFVLNDTWPPVAGGAPMMGPSSFESINNGHRARLGTFVELASTWNAQWTTLIGARNDTVWSNTGPVHGYSAMYAADAAAFNASRRAHTDVGSDVTALVRYEPNASTAFEAGYARKTRAPNLYERYAWSTSQMISSMIGWFGDGNYYVGNVNLKPEIAQTVSGTATLHDHARKVWEIKTTASETHIQDYVDVDPLATIAKGMSTFAQLRFANHEARIYSGNMSGDVVWINPGFGKSRLSGVAGWLHGERLDSRTSLYQMMPLHLRMNLDEEFKGWSAGFGVEAVDRKSDVDPHRFEQKTPGYALLHLQTAYHASHLQLSAAVDNLFNKNYALPLGGVNLDDFLASMSMSQIKPVMGRGRSAYLSATIPF